jgi:hypothetical protein
MFERIAVIILLILSGLVAGCSSEPEPVGLKVPRGAPAAIDGSLREAAWSGAYRAKLADGSELFLMHADGYLYLGLHGKALPAVNVYLDRGSEIAVLHASAALGTAIYEQVAGGWQRSHEFAWRCRETTDSARAQQARAEFLVSEGWLASNGNMGRPEETEYQIDFSAGRLRLAVVTIGPPDYDTPVNWPVDLADDCVDLEILRGPASTLAQYVSEGWVTVAAAP